MTEQSAVILFYADREPGPPLLWSDATAATRKIYRDRVDQIAAGEVRRSELSPAELAIWYGRNRFFEQRPPEHFVKLCEKAADARHPPPAPRRFSFWDTLGFEANSRGGDGRPTMAARTQLFGGHNVGHRSLSNIQVGSLFPSGEVALIRSMHVSACPDKDVAPVLEQALANSTVTLCIGDMPSADVIGVDLWHSPRRLDLLVPVRASYSVIIEFFGRDWYALLDRVLWRANDPKVDPFRIRVHLEGWRSARDV